MQYKYFGIHFKLIEYYIMKSENFPAEIYLVSHRNGNDQ